MPRQSTGLQQLRGFLFSILTIQFMLRLFGCTQGFPFPPQAVESNEYGGTFGS